MNIITTKHFVDGGNLFFLIISRSLAMRNSFLLSIFPFSASNILAQMIFLPITILLSVFCHIINSAKQPFLPRISFGWLVFCQMINSAEWKFLPFKTFGWIVFCRINFLPKNFFCPTIILPFDLFCHMIHSADQDSAEWRSAECFSAVWPDPKISQYLTLHVPYK